MGYSIDDKRYWDKQKEYESGRQAQQEHEETERYAQKLQEKREALFGTLEKTQRRRQEWNDAVRNKKNHNRNGSVNVAKVIEQVGFDQHDLKRALNRYDLI